jgi:hypothetical protein
LSRWFYSWEAVGWARSWNSIQKMVSFNHPYFCCHRCPRVRSQDSDCSTLQKK